MDPQKNGQNESKSSRESLTRRDFLAGAAAISSGVLAVPNASAVMAHDSQDQGSDPSVDSATSSQSGKVIVPTEPVVMLPDLPPNMWHPEPYNVPPEPVLLADTIESGELSINSPTCFAGEFGTWVVSYRVGMESIRTGGGIRVQLPQAWHAGPRHSPTRLQSTEPNHFNYVSARCSNLEVQLQTTVESQSDDVMAKTVKSSNLTRLAGYFVFIVRVIVWKGELREGDTISVIYGDQSGGGGGMRAGVLSSRPEPILLAVDTEGLGQFRLHAPQVRVSVQPGLPTEMIVMARSEAVVGEPSKLHLALLDSWANSAATYSTEVRLQLKAGQAEFPEVVKIEPGKGWTEITFTPRQTGVLRFQVMEKNRKLEATSNPIEAFKEKPAASLYWGELHSHTAFSVFDGLGAGEDAYDYARYVSGLDFYARTDHTEGIAHLVKNISQDAWQEYNRMADRYYSPGAFATLHAYEASFYAPYGHVNIFFRDEPGPMINPDHATLPEAWRALKPGEALTIPHHTVKMPHPIDWSDADNPRFRRNIEIYSAHGLSEVYEPTHPLAFEQSLFTNPSTSQKTGLPVQEAWLKGHKLSTVGGTDDHNSRPGQPQYGVTAVRSRSLTREDVFDALYARRTYATTGVRIILDFEVNGVPMGGEVESDGQTSLHVRAIGTDVIDRVEVLRHASDQAGFRIIHQIFPAQENVSFTLRDRLPKGDAIYYVRLRQRRLVRERIAMAWSSPIWVRVA